MACCRQATNACFLLLMPDTSPLASFDVHPLVVEAPEASLRPWVICLCAQWCGVCRDYRTAFEQVSVLLRGYRFAWVDVEDHAGLIGELDIETFPTLLVASAENTLFFGAITPHPTTLARVLEALTPHGTGVTTPLPPHEMSTLLRVLDSDPGFWVTP